MRGKKATNKELKERLDSNDAYRNQVLQRLLQHLNDGYSVESFPDLSPDQVELAIDNPLWPDWTQEALNQAKRVGMAMWERLGHAQASGKNLGNSRTWFYNMSHRYGWREKYEAAVEHKGAVAVNIVQYTPTTS